MLVSSYTKGMFYKLRDKERSTKLNLIFRTPQKRERSDDQEKKTGRRRCDATLSR